MCAGWRGRAIVERGLWGCGGVWGCASQTDGTLRACGVPPLGEGAPAHDTHPQTPRSEGGAHAGPACSARCAVLGRAVWDPFAPSGLARPEAWRDTVEIAERSTGVWGRGGGAEGGGGGRRSCIKIRHQTLGPLCPSHFPEEECSWWGRWIGQGPIVRPPALGRVPSRLQAYAGWDFRVYVRVHLLRRESSLVDRGAGCLPVGLG